LPETLVSTSLSRSSRRAGRRLALGQHYLVDRTVVELMVRAASIEGPERVLEIGTGKGVVTRELCKVATRVEAFEVDHENVLATRSLGLGGLVLHEEDAFAAPREFDVLVSSLPYSESSNFVDWLAKSRYGRAVVLLQRDFAQKLLAHPGDERYRAVSVISQISSEVRVIRDVPRTSFDPPPRVSSVLAMVAHKRSLSDEQIHLIKMLFSQRRRKLASALKKLHLGLQHGNASELSLRVEGMSSEQFDGILSRLAVV
jgi:16S rRNA (adenine1518-N6/adenine1519-N6)-dimethyltransferase